MRCSRSCSARRSATSGKALIPSAASPSTGARREARTRRHGHDRRLGLRSHGADRRRGARLDHSRRGTRAPRPHARSAAARALLPRRVSALHERPHGRNRSASGRKDDGGGSRRDVVPRHGPAVRAPVFRSRHAGGSGRPVANLDRCGTKSSGTGSRRAGARCSTGTGARTTAGRWIIEIRGWNECLITYVLAASSPRYSIEPAVYHRGFASGAGFRNRKS